MKYRAAYDRMMNRFRKRERPSDAAEKHHIIPKAIGGRDMGCVRVTHAEHSYAHIILNLALFQENRTEDLKKIDYHGRYGGKCLAFASAHALRVMKVTVLDRSGNRTPPMSLRSAAKRFAWIATPEHSSRLKFPAENPKGLDEKGVRIMTLRLADKIACRGGRFCNFRVELA